MYSKNRLSKPENNFYKNYYKLLTSLKLQLPNKNLLLLNVGIPNAHYYLRPNAHDYPGTPFGLLVASALYNHDN